MNYFDANTWTGRWPFAFIEDHTPRSLAAHLRSQLTDEGLSALCSIRSLRWLSLKHVRSLTDHTVCALLEALHLHRRHPGLPRPLLRHPRFELRHQLRAVLQLLAR